MSRFDDIYVVKIIKCGEAKDYIRRNHYSKGSHNGPSPCFGLYIDSTLIGVLMFATPCSENVRSSVFGTEHKTHVTELHRLHVADYYLGSRVPKGTTSWFISQSLKALKKIKPTIWGVITFADSTEGHRGTVYKATNALYCGMTSPSTFYLDEKGTLRHPRQNGVNISRESATERGWRAVRRLSKHRFLYFLPDSKGHKKKLLRMCKYTNTEETKEVEK
jgi:hypothetical protein